MKHFAFVIFLLSFSSVANERSSAFIINAYGEHFKVLGPAQFVGLKRIVKTQKVGVIIDNKTLTPLIGKIENKSGTKRVNVSVGAGKDKSYEISIGKGDQFFFYPLSPAFQEVELKIGLKAYEIPPKQ